MGGSCGASLGSRDAVHDDRHPDDDMSRSGLKRGGPNRFLGLDVDPQKRLDGSSMPKKPGEMYAMRAERRGLLGQTLP